MPVPWMACRSLDLSASVHFSISFLSGWDPLFIEFKSWGKEALSNNCFGTLNFSSELGLYC